MQIDDENDENVENKNDINPPSIPSGEEFGKPEIQQSTRNTQNSSEKSNSPIQGLDITNKPEAFITGDTGNQGIPLTPSTFKTHNILPASNLPTNDVSGIAFPKSDKQREATSSSEDFNNSEGYSDSSSQTSNTEDQEEELFSLASDEDESKAETSERPAPQNDNSSEIHSQKYSNQGVKDSNNPIEGIPSDDVTPDDDKAGFHLLSKAIAGVVRNKELRLPYNIGIIGPYGSGKSKIIEQVKRALKSDIKDAVPVKIVNFDVGRYHSSEHIWSALIFAFFDAFKKDKKGCAAWVFFNTLGNLEKFASISKITGAFLLSILLITWKFIPWLNKVELFKIYFHELLFVGSLFLLIRTILKIWLHPAVAGSIDKMSTMPLNLVKEFENRIAFESKLKRLFKAWTNENISERVILFVENLDRCSKKHVIEIVDELYALISTPEIENKLICIVAVDDEAIKKSIKESHGVATNEYFEKLFSLKLHVPKLSGSKLSNFLNELTGYKPINFIGSSKPELALNYENYRLKDDEKEFIYQMLGGAANRDGVTPRKAKRMISSYQFLKYIWPNWFEGEEFNPANLASTVFNRLAGKKKELKGPYKVAASLIGKDCEDDI